MESGSLSATHDSESMRGGVKEIDWMRLAHGWKLARTPALTPATVREFIRPAVRAIPAGIARRLKPCRIVLQERLEGKDAVSRWTETGEFIEIEVESSGHTEHDVALEVLVCAGQALWGRLKAEEETAWLVLLRAEVDAGVEGEIDEDALKGKRVLLSSMASARSTRRLAAYARAAFAGTAAEYVHSLWHDVSLRAGEGHLPAKCVRRRLELLARWFPPGPGYRLFP